MCQTIWHAGLCNYEIVCSSNKMKSDLSKICVWEEIRIGIMYFLAHWVLSSHSGMAEDSCLLGCETVSLERYFPKFWGACGAITFRVKQSKYTKQTAWPWGKRHCDPSQQWELSAQKHSATSQKSGIYTSQHVCNQLVHLTRPHCPPPHMKQTKNGWKDFH